MYYRISLGLSSKLLKYDNGIIYLEITLSKKWAKNYNATAAELAYSWKSSHPELCKALGCKVYIVDLREDNNRQFLQTQGITTQYDAYKGVIFRKNYMN
ncbi:MAG: hypothetical protein WAT79_16370 [Saprospiraceae bacterium]